MYSVGLTDRARSSPWKPGCPVEPVKAFQEAEPSQQELRFQFHFCAAWKNTRTYRAILLDNRVQKSEAQVPGRQTVVSIRLCPVALAGRVGLRMLTPPARPLARTGKVGEVGLKKKQDCRRGGLGSPADSGTRRSVTACNSPPQCSNCPGLPQQTTEPDLNTFEEQALPVHPDLGDRTESLSCALTYRYPKVS